MYEKSLTTRVNRDEARRIVNNWAALNDVLILDMHVEPYLQVVATKRFYTSKRVTVWTFVLAIIAGIVALIAFAVIAYAIGGDFAVRQSGVAIAELLLLVGVPIVYIYWQRHVYGLLRTVTCTPLRVSTAASPSPVVTTRTRTPRRTAAMSACSCAGSATSAAYTSSVWRAAEITAPI